MTANRDTTNVVSSSLGLWTTGSHPAPTSSTSWHHKATQATKTTCCASNTCQILGLADRFTLGSADASYVYCCTPKLDHVAQEEPLQFASLPCTTRRTHHLIVSMRISTAPLCMERAANVCNSCRAQEYGCKGSCRDFNLKRRNWSCAHINSAQQAQAT